MKKLISLLLILTIAIIPALLSSCNKEKESTATSDNTQTTASQSTQIEQTSTQQSQSQSTQETSSQESASIVTTTEQQTAQSSQTEDLSGFYYELEEDEDGNEYYAVGADDPYAMEDDLLIPAEFRGISVKKIMEYGFKETGIRTLKIPKSITIIEYSAFSGCTLLHTVEFEENSNLTIINENAFAGCNSLSTITLPPTLEIIGKLAFASCIALETIEITAPIIEEGAFTACTGLTEFTFTKMMTKIGMQAFAGCNDLTVIDLRENINELTEILSGAFTGCTKIEKIYFSDKMTSIPTLSFAGTNVLSEIYIPSSIILIDDAAFPVPMEIAATIYYSGTQEQWEAITIGNSNGGITGITNEGEYIFPPANVVFNHVITG